MTELTETADIAPAEATPAEPVPAVVLPTRRPFSAFTRAAGGIAAIGVKELRGRMRGRRAFAILTIYLVLLGGFALMAERLVESQYTSGFGGSSAFAGAAIGQGIFAALLMLMTLQVVFLAPSSTSPESSASATTRSSRTGRSRRRSRSPRSSASRRSARAASTCS